MCKCGNILSKAVLISRGLDQESMEVKEDRKECRKIRKILFSFECMTESVIHRVGDEGKEGTPVPMPNTEVKLFSVDDTWRVTARESRTLPT